ncbi:hypothetical protein [Nonomuraea cavernae]|uniref:Transposase n=1 Tax=Nonomuraea cavernae TaxID=2045107 RepID=A0A917Z8Y9_9ACTN|nr:hypothetical protein [Nonomuraea cavernae]MCA2188844.1 hypothetical protein [Nonomuraea cavernae]GGO78415.1 hypothetical protein GCM10012289_60340 [Nonomuraea cavernae]
MRSGRGPGPYGEASGEFRGGSGRAGRRASGRAHHPHGANAGPGRSPRALGQLDLHQRSHQDAEGDRDLSDLVSCRVPHQQRLGTPVTELITVAGLRWKIKENNETGKDLLGLTEYQVRKWDGWHRHVTTAMLALAFLAVSRAHLDGQSAPDPVPPAADQGKDPHHQEILS